MGVFDFLFGAKKLLLIAIYENWQDMKVSDIAEYLNVSKMSISRCFDEIEYLNVNALSMKGKSRVVSIPTDKKAFWHELRPILRNPVINKFILSENEELPCKAGGSALCEYSLLSDNEYPTYLITKKK